MMGGVSRSLNVNFVRACPVKEGGRVRVRSWVVQHGRTACLIRGQIESLDGEVVFATGEHTKLQTPLDQEQLGLIREWKEMEKEQSNKFPANQGIPPAYHTLPTWDPPAENAEKSHIDLLGKPQNAGPSPSPGQGHVHNGAMPHHQQR